MADDDLRDVHRIYLETSLIYLPDSVLAILIAGNMLTLIMALCGNIAALIIIVRAKLSKVHTKLFLATLALADLVLLLSSIPIELGKLTDKYLSWVFGTFLCQTIASVQTHAVMMNAICLCGIALERYLSVIRSPKMSKISGRWETHVPYLVLGLTWILPFAASIPMLWAYEEWSFWVMQRVNISVNQTALVRMDNETHYLCQSRDEDFPFRAELWSTLVLTYFLILAGFLLCYMSIINFVRNRGVNFSKSSSPPSASNSNNTASGSRDTNSLSTTSDPPRANLSPTLAVPKHQHRRTVKLIMALILVFVICRTPIMIFNLVYNINQSNKAVAKTSAMYFLHLLSNVNAAISPFMYVIWNNSLKSVPARPPDSRKIKSGRTSHCCWPASGWVRNGSRTIFTNTSSTSSTNVFKTRQHSFTVNSQSRVHSSDPPSPSLAQNFQKEQVEKSADAASLAPPANKASDTVACDNDNEPSTTSSTEAILNFCN